MATPDGGREPFDLLSTDALVQLGDRDSFIACLDEFYRMVATQWGCEVITSDRRLGDAHDFWLDDVNRTQHLGIDRKRGAPPDEETQLDHFKHGSIVAFWLRRLVPINETWHLMPNGQVDDSGRYTPGDAQAHFLQYGNELCALLAGFNLIVNYELQRRQEDLKAAGIEITEASRREYVRRLMLPARFKYEFPKLLKNKNISSHALYMMYRALFDAVIPVEPPPTG